LHAISTKIEHLVGILLVTELHTQQHGVLGKTQINQKAFVL